MLVFGGGGGCIWMFPKISGTQKYGWFIMESPINPWMIWAKSSHLMDLLFRRFHPPGRYYGPCVELQKGFFFSPDFEVCFEICLDVLCSVIIVVFLGG